MMFSYAFSHMIFFSKASRKFYFYKNYYLLLVAVSFFLTSVGNSIITLAARALNAVKLSSTEEKYCSKMKYCNPVVAPKKKVAVLAEKASNDDEIGNEDCAICLDSFSLFPSSDLSCGHCFHVNFIGKILKLGHDLQVCLAEPKF